MAVSWRFGKPWARPRAARAGARYLAAFVEDVKASGFVAKALKRSNQSAAVAPPAAK